MIPNAKKMFSGYSGKTFFLASEFFTIFFSHCKKKKIIAEKKFLAVRENVFFSKYQEIGYQETFLRM